MMSFFKFRERVNDEYLEFSNDEYFKINPLGQGCDIRGPISAQVEKSDLGVATEILEIRWNPVLKILISTYFVWIPWRRIWSFGK